MLKECIDTVYSTASLRGGSDVTPVPLGQKQHNIQFLGREHLKMLAVHAAEGQSLKSF